jgi:hypothetical protein
MADRVVIEPGEGRTRVGRHVPWLAGVIVIVATSGATYHALHYASRPHSDDVFWWTLLVTPFIGAVGGWFVRPDPGLVRGRVLRAATRLVLGAAGGLAVAVAGAYVTSMHTACDGAEECGFGVFVGGWFALIAAAVLLGVGLVLATLAWLTARRRPTP